MHKLTKTTNSIKKFVADHKVGLTVVATAVVTTAACAKISRIGMAAHEEFLESKGLLEEWNALFEEDE